MVAWGRARNQVGANRGLEQVRLLPGECEQAADVRLAVLTSVPPGDRNAALLGIEEPEQQVRDGRLACAARPDERHPSSRRERQVDPAERGGLVGPVAGRHALERDDRGKPRRWTRLGRITDGRSAVGQLEHAAPARHGFGQLARGGRQGRDHLEGGEGEQRNRGDKQAVE